MQRLKEYSGFIVWFVGLTTIAVWSLALTDFDPGAATTACRSNILRGLCEWMAPMPPALRLVGLLAAVFVMVRLLLIALRATQPRAAEPPAANPKPKRWRRPAPTVARVKGRDHFGLRGLPR